LSNQELIEEGICDLIGKKTNWQSTC
jgi:hypothetical protein